MTEAIRSFIAFDLDDESILRRISAAQSDMLKTGADLKVVEPQNIHATIRFLDSISPSMVERVYEVMKKVQFSHFDIVLHGVGVFPNPRYIRVVWAGMKEGGNQLRSIFEQLEPNLQKLGFRPDPKGFSPHLTFARVRSGRKMPELARWVQENADFDFGTIKAECLKLKRSDLRPTGPIYTTLHEHCAQGQ